MKKILALAMIVAMILSVAAIGASAKKANLTGSAGVYAIGSHAEFSKVGDITVHWVPDAQEKLNLKDGDLEDWVALGIEPTTINTSNMVAWFGTSGPEGWEMSAYFLADKDYLYIGFYIKDDDVVPLADKNSYRTGDAFQINIDFGRKLGWILENDPDTADILTNTQNVFYSFGYRGDGEAVSIHVECSDNDRDITEEGGVIGSTGATDDGWCAEFTIPFQDMYNDYMYKAYLDEGEETAVTIDADNPFLLGAGLYYMDFTTADDGTTSQTWAAGTHSGFAGTDADGNDLDPATNAPIVRWDAYDNAMNLILNYVEGMEFTCNGILVGDEEYETSAPDDDDPVDTGDAPAESEDESAEAPAESEGESAEAPAESEDDSATPAESEGESAAAPAESKDETKADDKKADEGGCASVVAFGAVAVLAAAAVVVLKKKD